MAYWLVWCHKVDGRGHPFPQLRELMHKDVDLSLLWLMLSMCTSINALWENVVQAICIEEAWHGWFFLYATKQCFSYLVIRGVKINS